MKLIKCAIFVFVVSLFLANISFATSLTNASEFRISTLKYEPYPAEPGKYLQLWLNIENAGLYSANQVTFELEPTYPFSLDANENATRYFGSIEPMKSVVIDYKIRVAADAVEGQNELKLKYRSGDGIWNTKKFSITVKTPNAIISVDNVKTEPKTAVPGKETNLTITLKNVADSPLKDISLKLDLSSVPFSPIGKTTEHRVYLLQPNESVDITFNLLASPDIDAGPYKIPVNISYDDWTGIAYLKKDFVTVVVGDIPELIIGLEETQILQAGESGTVTLNLINKGLIGIKFLLLTLNKTENYDILSPSNQIYIGKLGPDDYETAKFNLYIKPVSGKSITLPITLEYRDDNNNKFTEHRKIEFKLYTQEEITKYGLRQTSGMTNWIILLVLIVAGYFVYRKFRKK